MSDSTDMQEINKPHIVTSCSLISIITTTIIVILYYYHFKTNDYRHRLRKALKVNFFPHIPSSWQ